MSSSHKLLTWREGSIHDVAVAVLEDYKDERGWLCELFREDELPGQLEQRPMMGYTSMTKPGVMRGPHEHRHQTDIFVFNGDFEIFLWDARDRSSSYRLKQKVRTHNINYTRVIVPPGIVHGYRNISTVDGLTLNFPNRLYKGFGKKEGVDEIRHEDDKETQYVPWE